MVHLHVQHKVEDYGKWKAVFDAQAPARKAAGGTGTEYILRNADNPNELVVVLEWDNLDNARQFSQSPELKEAMQNAGVTGMPEILFLESAA